MHLTTNDQFEYFILTKFSLVKKRKLLENIFSAPFSTFFEGSHKLIFHTFVVDAHTPNLSIKPIKKIEKKIIKQVLATVLERALLVEEVFEVAKSGILERKDDSVRDGVVSVVVANDRADVWWAWVSVGGALWFLTTHRSKSLV